MNIRRVVSKLVEFPMPNEYKLVFNNKSFSDMDKIFRSLPGFFRFDKDSKKYEYRIKSNPGKVPNVTLALLENAIYLHDHGGKTDFSDQIKSLLREQLGDFTISEYK